jgi:hypothetical protein
MQERSPFIASHRSPVKEKVQIMKLNSNVYDVLKSVAQIWLPGAGTLYFTLAQIWGLPGAEEVTGTVVAFDTFLGLFLSASSAKFNSDPAKYDGTLTIEEGEDGSTLRLSSVDAHALTTKDEILFKVKSQPAPPTQ